MELSVFGLGYVGCVSAACFAREGHQVVGVDVSADKVAMINQGKATIVEQEIGDILSHVVAAGRLHATTDAIEAVTASSSSLICVGTPSLPNGGVDLRHVENVCGEIGLGIRRKVDRHTVIVRSTVLPGTTTSAIIPALERVSGKRAGYDFGVCVNPEFLREGSSLRDFYDPPFTVIGTDDPHTAELGRALHTSVNAPLYIVAADVAEMLKYASNCFHGLKVGFTNEIGNLCKALGIDSHELMRLFCLDSKLNISSAYLKPGFSFGGSCLPKDLRALIHRAKELDLAVPILSATLDSNQRQLERAYDMVAAAGSRRVGVLGLAFKAGTDDLRESPLVRLVELLIGKGFQLSIYDGEVSRARLVGANRAYIEREIPHIWSLMRDDLNSVLSASDTIVIGNAAAEFGAIGETLRENQVVIDLVRAFGPKLSDGRTYQGICW